MALEEIRNELSRCDGETVLVSDDKTSIKSAKTKKPLIERVDEVQSLLTFSEVQKERRLLKNKELNLLREFYSQFKPLAGAPLFS